MEKLELVKLGTRDKDELVDVGKVDDNELLEFCEAEELGRVKDELKLELELWSLENELLIIKKLEDESAVDTLDDELLDV